MSVNTFVFINTDCLNPSSIFVVAVDLLLQKTVKKSVAATLLRIYKRTNCASRLVLNIFPMWLQAGFWGLVGGSALLLGAALGYFVKMPQRAIALVQWRLVLVC